MLLWAPFGSIIFLGYEAFSAKRAEYFGETEKLVTLKNYCFTLKFDLHFEIEETNN